MFDLIEAILKKYVHILYIQFEVDQYLFFLIFQNYSEDLNTKLINKKCLS